MIRQIEVDGVPALLAPASGPIRAGLGFRVGMADEPLARRGITHLIEHLALHSVGVADHHYNGATGVQHTYFHMQGAEAEIAGFLNGVCASLRDLPMRRMATEKDLLHAEANGRAGGVTDQLPMWRHGARDYGMPSYPEWGLPTLTEDDLREWVARYFTRENAVLWVSGDSVPAGLKLDLPAGERRPVPRPSSALPATPAWFGGSVGIVAWDTVVRREPRAAVLAGVLERTMFRTLRQRDGLSYTAQTSYEPFGADQAIITAVADSLPDKPGAVLGGLVDLLAALRVGRIDPADVAAVVNQRCEAIEQADEQGARLPGQALGLLAGRAPENVEEAVAGLRAVTVRDVAELAVEACSGALLMTPRGVRGDWAGFVAAPIASESAVPGQEFASLEDPAGRLIVGADGVSLVGEHHRATVRFDACVLVRAWPDGARQLVGADAIVVHVEPTLYANGHAALPGLDALIPAGVRVEQPARAPGQIPEPVRFRRTTPWSWVTRRNAGRVVRELGPAVLLTLFLGFCAVASLLQLVHQPAVAVGGLAVFGYAGYRSGSNARQIIGRLRAAS